VLLADASDPPAVMNPGEIRARYRVVQTPGHYESPTGVVLARNFALVCNRLAAEGERAGIDEGFGCAVGTAAGVDY
jgi:hypothetical protein